MTDKEIRDVFKAHGLEDILRSDIEIAEMKSSVEQAVVVHTLQRACASLGCHLTITETGFSVESPNKTCRVHNTVPLTMESYNTAMDALKFSCLQIA